MHIRQDILRKVRYDRVEARVKKLAHLRCRRAHCSRHLCAVQVVLGLISGDSLLKHEGEGLIESDQYVAKELQGLLLIMTIGLVLLALLLVLGYCWGLSIDKSCRGCLSCCCMVVTIRRLLKIIDDHSLFRS